MYVLHFLEMNKVQLSMCHTFYSVLQSDSESRKIVYPVDLCPFINFDSIDEDVAGLEDAC